MLTEQEHEWLDRGNMSCLRRKRAYIVEER